MAKGITLTEQQAAELIAQQAGIEVDNSGYIRESDPGKAKGRMRDTGFEQKIASMNQRLRATGVHPATVFNFLPVVISVNSPLNSVRGGVPAVKGAEPFASRTWKDVDIQAFHDGDSGRVPHESHPLQIAEAFQKEYPHGGVLALFGGVDAAERPENKPLIAKAKTDAVKWMRGQVENGDRKWNAPNNAQRHNVLLQERQSAHRLKALGILQALPVWVDPPTMELEAVPVACASCGKTPENRGALRCSCGYILDPEQAFVKGIINEEDESLERLTREQVVRIGVSAYVAETADEKPARLKAGVPKPFSIAYERAAVAAEAARQS